MSALLSLSLLLLKVSASETTLKISLYVFTATLLVANLDDKLELKFRSGSTRTSRSGWGRHDSETCLPDAAEIAQVKDVVELGRRRKHLHLGLLPELPGRRNQTVDDMEYFLLELALLSIFIASLIGFKSIIIYCVI